MALFACSECGKSYSDQAAACVHCGARNPKYKSAGTRFLIGVLILVCGIFILIGVIAAFDNPTPEQKLSRKGYALACKNQPWVQACIDYRERHKAEYGEDP